MCPTGETNETIMKSMRFAALLLLPLTLVAQVPATDPPYDPNDPEGMVNHPNGWARFPWKRVGTWVMPALHCPYGRPNETPPATPVEVKQMDATWRALTAILRATPEAAEPRGYFVKESRTFGYFSAHGTYPGFQTARLPLVYSAGYFPFYNEDTLKNGVWSPVTGGETESVYFYFNRLPDNYKQPIVAEEPRGRDLSAVEFFPRPDTSTSYAGFPILDGEDLVIVRGGRDPYLTVPYERALKAAMVKYQQDLDSATRRLADLKKTEAETLTPEYEQKMRDHLEKYSGQFRTTDPKKWQGRVAGMERELVYNREKARKDANPQRDKDGDWYWTPVLAHEDAARRLAAMTPELAASPACYLPKPEARGRNAMRGDIQPMGADPKCRELVMSNQGYFDPKLPRSAPQILLVRTFGRCAKVENGQLVGPRPVKSLYPPQGCYRHVPIWAAMDWQKAAALLAP